MLPDPIPQPSAHPSLLDLAVPAEVGPPAVDWLWPGWIPRGMLTLLAAAPGAGKSLLALDLARRVIAGLPFPDGAPAACPDQREPRSEAERGANVLLVDTEGPLSLLDRRARAWEIDRSRLFLMLPPDGSYFDLSASAQYKHLVHMIRDLEPALLIIDSLGAALPGGEAVAKSLHRLLAVLPRLAAHANLALLLIHHLRKRTYAARAAAPVTLDDLRGSSRIVAVARSILALSPFSPSPSLPLPASYHPGAKQSGPPLPPPAARRLEVLKSNLGPIPLPLGLLLEPGRDGAPSLRYTGPILPPAPAPSRLDLCAAWLLDYLANAGRPVRPPELVLAAAAAGFSRATLYRARHALGLSTLRQAPSTPEGEPPHP